MQVNQELHPLFVALFNAGHFNYLLDVLTNHYNTDDEIFVLIVRNLVLRAQQKDSPIEIEHHLAENDTVSSVWFPLGLESNVRKNKTQGINNESFKQAWQYFVRTDGLETSFDHYAWGSVGLALASTLQAEGMMQATYLTLHMIEHTCSSWVVHAEGWSFRAGILWLWGFPREALGLFKKAQRVMEDCGLFNKLGSLYNNMGNLYSDYYDVLEGITLYQKGAKVASQLNDNQLLCTVLNNLGATELELGQYRTAMMHLQQALVQAEQLGLTSATLFPRINLGDLHTILGEVNTAKEYYENVLVDLPATSTHLAVGHAHVGYGKVLLLMGRTKLAEEYFNLALKEFKTKHDIFGLVRTYGERGKVYYLLGEFEEAAQAYRNLFDISLHKLDKQLPEHILEFVSLLVDEEDLPTAQTFLVLAEQIAKKNNADISWAYAELSCALFHSARLNIDNAKRSASRALFLAKTLGNVEIQIRSRLILVEQAMQESLLRQQGISDDIVHQLEDLRHFVEAQGYYYFHVPVLLLNAVVHSLRNPLTLAEGAVDHALEMVALAEEQIIQNGLRIFQPLVSQTKQRLTYLKQLVSLNLDNGMIYNLWSQSGTNYVRKMVRSATGRRFHTHQNLEVFVNVFKSSDVGVVEVLGDELRSDTGRGHLELSLHMGNIYSTLIATGNRYTTGLFGPLPFVGQTIGGVDYGSLVFTRFMTDHTHLDPRMAGKTYVLVCITIPMEMDFDRTTLLEFLTETFDLVQEVQEIQPTFPSSVREFLNKVLY